MFFLQILCMQGAFRVREEIVPRLRRHTLSGKEEESLHPPGDWK
jgi:hypothetical protein